MTDARSPDSESQRVAAVHALELLDTEPEERFDRITRLAQISLDVPIALITLLDADRLWFKSRRGIEATEVPRELSFCSVVVETNRQIIVPDLTLDPRFRAHPLVTGEPFIRAYAGVPVHDPAGTPVGTVCVLDYRARSFGPEQQELLALLAGITERELQSHELADTLALVGEMNRRAAAVADSITEALITLGDDGLVTSANPAALEMFGYDRQHLIGASALVLLHADDRDAYRGYLERYLRGESSQVLGTRRHVTGVRRDGSTFDMELVVTITQTEHGREFVSVCRDISERVRMERALLAGQELLGLLSDAALEGLAVREGGVIVRANRAFAEMFGFEPDAVLGMAPEDFMAPETHAILSTYFPDREGELVEAIGRRRDGTRFPIEFAARDLSTGGVERRVVSIRDVTARRAAEERAEAELRATQAARRTIRAIVDATREAMLFLNADGRIAFVNQGLFNLFTRGQAVDLDGHRIAEFEDAITASFGESGQVLMATIDDGLHERDAEIVFVIEQSAPERRDLDLVIRPVFDPDGGYIGRLFVFRDITAERELDRTKREFVSTVAHELRTPLTSIKGYVDLLLEGDVGALGPTHERMLAVVRRNADRLAALVSDLLDVSQLEAGGLELRREPADIESLIRDAIAVMRPQFTEKRQSLAIEVAPGLPTISVDAPRMVQVMTNLLSNAHKYTPDEGHIAIRATRGDGSIDIEVEDDGVGLSPDEIEQLFTKFYRARNRATVDVGGTGLGLAITRSLVELHGGTIDVCSAPDRGTAFVVHVPLVGGPGIHDTTGRVR
ncbi:MAG: PAS domain S-box protein [Chloroflexi bacterium]|nr:PAS domain S-box protein [Chloroflexota bacterium]